MGKLPLPGGSSPGFPLSELLPLIGGEIVSEGSGVSDPRGVIISALCPLEDPVANGLSFTRATKAAAILSLTQNVPLAALLLSENAEAPPIASGVVLVKVRDPLAAIVQLTSKFYSPPLPSPGVSPSAVVDPTAQLGSDVTIGPFTWIGPGVRIGNGAIIYSHVALYADVTIGARAKIHSHAVVREGCTIGEDTTLLNGAVVGAEGFGYFFDPSYGGLRAVPQIGSVQLGAQVDVGANACIDRATLGSTRIGRGTKIDNLVQVGHNAQIGEHAILCGQVGIAGSSKIGNQVVLGGGAGVADHVTIGDGIRVGALAGVSSDLVEKGDYNGYPAVPISAWRRQMAALRRLPELLRKGVFGKDLS